MELMDRRGFLQGAALASGSALVCAAGLGAQAALADEAAEGVPAIPYGFTAEDIANSSVELEPITEFAAEETYDIVVVGAGNAGMSAALQCQLAGK